MLNQINPKLVVNNSIREYVVINAGTIVLKWNCTCLSTLTLGTMHLLKKYI